MYGYRAGSVHSSVTRQVREISDFSKGPNCLEGAARAAQKNPLGRGRFPRRQKRLSHQAGQIPDETTQLGAPYQIAGEAIKPRFQISTQPDAGRPVCSGVPIPQPPIPAPQPPILATHYAGNRTVWQVPRALGNLFPSDSDVHFILYPMVGRHPALRCRPRTVYT